MPLLADFFSELKSFTVNWIPLLFFGLMCMVVWLLWKTVKLMPRVKPMEIAARPLAAARIRKLFAEARKNAPSIVFIDLDASTGRSSSGRPT